MDKLYIVIPAYNEEVNIQKTIQQWYPIIEKHATATIKKSFFMVV